ncbi:MAG TPA: TRAP transporter large permease [Thermodesulfobacteriaceae bacterium]|nr:TRAP transporter large permease [Thermodesulfobacteriaceae bacterium]
MDPCTVGILGIAALLAVLFLFKIPVGFAMALVGFAGFAWVVSPTAAISSAGNAVWQTFSSYGLAVIPFFIFMGNICFQAGVSNRLYNTAHAWIGHIRGGIAMATIMACAGFAAICGSNAATAATMSAVALPEMKKLGYRDCLNTGAVASGATLGVIIPPSVVLIVIGLSTGESIAKLFFAALLPGLILSASLLVTVFAICRIHPEWGPSSPRTSFRQKLASLPGSVEMLILFCLVMAGLYLGWFTPTEAGAAGAFFSLTIAIAGRNITWKKFAAAMKDTVHTSSMILIIVAGAVIFGKFLTITRLPYETADWVAGLPVPRSVILMMMLAIYIFGGAIMDALGLLMITIPIFFPVAEKLGYNPLWFAVIITIITSMGAITPPVGINTYIVAGMAGDVPLSSVFRGVTYFLGAFAACIALMLLFPSLATMLPELLR